MLATKLSEGQGLGNQLFCYVTTRAIAAKRGLDFSILGGETLANNIHSECGLYFMDLDMGVSSDESDYSNVYNEREDRIYIGNSRHDYQHGCYVTGTDNAMLEVPDNTILMGNMQSEAYYSDYISQIKDWLRVKPEYDCYDYSKENLCILHLRCSDYTHFPELFLRKRYWIRGMKAMRKINPDMEFMIITNDVKEASKILPGIPAYNFDLAKDYSIIKNAKYLLLSNSSFTYFPALCSETVEYIIAPKYWARHNVSKGYWASEQNIYTGWHYMDRSGRVFTADECRKELEEFKKTSKYYKRLNVPPSDIQKKLWKAESEFLYQRYYLLRLFRGLMRKIRVRLGIQK